MNEQDCLSKMIAPGTRRAGKWLGGVIQIWVTRQCDLSCFGCTQGSNLAGAKNQHNMTPDQFRQACRSLKGYFGVVGMFGGNPALHPQFEELCAIMRKEVPAQQRGLWCNNPMGKGKVMSMTFNPGVSNLNVHMNNEAFKEFKKDWPSCHPFGLERDSRHSPPYVAMKDVLLTDCKSCQGRGWFYNPPLDVQEYEAETGNRKYITKQPCLDCKGGKVYDIEKGHELISACDINRHWSAMIGVFRGQLRAWFCEIAGAQSMLHQDEPDYPDTGLSPLVRYSLGGFDTGNELAWWQLKMPAFQEQVRKHCHDCGVPLRGYGELAVSNKDGTEQVSNTHLSIYKPKKKGRAVELVTIHDQLKQGKIHRMTDYIQNSGK